jgi:hypothetical protein
MLLFGRLAEYLFLLMTIIVIIVEQIINFRNKKKEERLQKAKATSDEKNKSTVSGSQKTPANK